MGLHICNECAFKKNCSSAFTQENGSAWFCLSVVPGVKEEQEKRLNEVLRKTRLV